MADTSPVGWDVRFLLHVADCKLASSENMRFIAEQHGTFLTILPRTRKEMDLISRTMPSSTPSLGRKCVRDPHPRRKDGPDSVYHGWESPSLSKEGFRVLWLSQLAKNCIRIARNNARNAWPQHGCS